MTSSMYYVVGYIMSYGATIKASAANSDLIRLKT